MAIVHHLIAIIPAVRASQIQLSPPAVRGPARPAARTRVATLGIAIVRPIHRVAVRNRQCADSAPGRPVKAPIRIIVPEHPARERNPAQLAATRSLGLADEIIFTGHDLAWRS
jgi:hypothetical protein